MTRRIPFPQSTTQCELVGIFLAAKAAAREVLTDSASSLMTLQNWDTWSVARQLRCRARAEVRACLFWLAKNKTRRLEKVKSHVEGPGATVKHRWNSVADAEAKKAVASGPLWGTSLGVFRSGIPL